ncbi:MAG: SGNH/GDSL hydrolase family protein [Candidatus Thorarchaeota archaeon]
MKVLCFGDSLTAGTPGFEPGYGGDVRSQYGFWLIEEAKKEDYQSLEFTNRGVPGELASMMYSRFRRTLNEDDYDVAIILGGSNDIGWGNEPVTIHASLNRLWQLGIENSITVIACTIPPIGSEYPTIQRAQQNLNELIKQSTRKDILFVNIFSVLADKDRLLLPVYDSGDGLHLSVEGYRKVGETIWKEALRNHIAGSS